MPSNTEIDQQAVEFAKTLTNVPWCEAYERMISGMMYEQLASTYLTCLPLFTRWR